MNLGCIDGAREEQSVSASSSITEARTTVDGTTSQSLEGQRVCASSTMDLSSGGSDRTVGSESKGVSTSTT